MILGLLRYLILFLIIGNMPAYMLVYFGPSYGSAASYLTSFLLIVYFVFVKSWSRPLFPFLLLGILYFTLGGVNYVKYDPSNYFLKEFLRFMILVVCAPEVLKRTKHRDIFYLALVGAFSVVVNAMVFPESNMIHGLVIGRYSGFYLNPNSAGTVCLIGFALSYSIKSIKWRYMGQFAFTLAGLLTLSRTFIVVWLLINIFAIYRQKRNVWVPFIGAAVLVLVLTFTDRTIFAADRFEALSSFFDEGPVKTKTIKHDSRTATWAQYYPLISEKPLLGHGFGSFQTKENNLPGAHNGFLLVIGEAGIIPFFLFLGVYIYLLVCSLKIFKQYPEILYMCLVLILALMASHTYFTSYFIVFMSMYLYIKLRHYRVPHT